MNVKVLSVSCYDNNGNQMTLYLQSLDYFTLEITLTNLERNAAKYINDVNDTLFKQDAGILQNRIGDGRFILSRCDENTFVVV